MMDQTRTTRTGFVVAITGLVALILTACGGGDDADSTPRVTNDAFMAKVITVVETTPDYSDPELTDSIVATSPETTEPIAVVF